MACGWYTCCVPLWRLFAEGGGWWGWRGALGGQDEGAYASSEAQGPLYETLPHHALIRSAGLIGLG